MIGRVVRGKAFRSAGDPMECDALAELSREQLLELVVHFVARVAEVEA